MQKSNAQDVLWSSTYPAGAASQGYSIKQTIDGGFIIGGSAQINSRGKDIYIIRLTVNGDTLWTKTLGGTADDEAFCISLTPDTGCIVACYSNSYGSGSSDFFIVKLNKLGEIQWTSTNGGALADGSYSVIATKDGGYLALGYTTSTGNGGRDIKAIKLNASGMVIWTKTYGGINNETAYSVCQMFDSSYVIVGSTKSFGAVDNDVYVIKTNTMGDTLWTKVYAGTGTDIAYAVYPCEERGFVVAGKTNSEGAGGYDMLLMKIYDDGYLLWKKTYGSEGDQVAYDVKETKNFGFVLGGTTTISNRTNSYLVSVNDFGDSIYYQNYPANYNEEIRSICVTTENTFVFTGSNSDFTLLNVTGVKSCYIFFPRGIWFGQCWNFNSNNNILLKKQTMLINSSGQTWQEKVADFVSYCGAIQVHTVVLNNLEDIIRLGNQYLDGGTYYDFQNFPKDLGTCPCYPNDLAAPCQNCNTAEITGDTLRLRLKRLVELLHKDAHVSVVLAQWLDQDSLQYNKEIPATSCSTTVACNFALNYHSDETNLAHENHREILLAFNELNDPAGTTNLGFDGLMLDYEYFAPHYGVTWDGNGNPNDCDFFFFKQGYAQWQTIINLFIIARTNWQSTGVKFVEAYLNYIVLDKTTLWTTAANCKGGTPNTTVGFFDIDGPGHPSIATPDGVTDISDIERECWDIDKLGLDGIVLAFPPHDQISCNTINPSGTAYEVNKCPTTFLTGIQDANGETDIERDRARVLLFGHDPLNKVTPIIPWFRTATKDACTGVGWLGDVLDGSCFWNQNSSTNSTSVCTPPSNGWPLPGSTANANYKHYLPDIEAEFWNQVFVQIWENSDYSLYGYSNWGYVDFYKGFQYFQYGLNDALITSTTHDALLDANQNVKAEREGDTKRLMYPMESIYCDVDEHNESRFNYTSNSTIESELIADNKIIIYPNPVKNSATIFLKLKSNSISINNCEVKDADGRNSSNLFNINKTSDKNKLSLLPNENAKGFFILSVKLTDGQVLNTTFVISR